MRELAVCGRPNSYSDTEAPNPARIAGMSATTTANFGDRSFDLPAWKTIVSHVAAAAVAIIFLATGIAKLVVPFLVQTMFEQLLVPTWGSMPLVILLGIAETLGRPAGADAALPPLGRMVDRADAGRIHGLHRLALSGAGRPGLQLLPLAEARR